MSPRPPADDAAERAKARAAIIDLARRIREAGSPDVAAAAMPPAEAEAVGRALARYAADLRHSDTECAEALSSARWACISTPEDAARWAADRAHLAAVNSPVGAAVRQLAAVPIITESRDPALATEGDRKRARTLLEAELFKAAAVIAAAADAAIAPLDAGATIDFIEGEPFPVDEAIASALEATGGAAGCDRAAEVRGNSAARVRAYLENPSPEAARALAAAWQPPAGGSVPPCLPVVAWALWRDIVRPTLADGLKRHPPALPAPVMRAVALGLHSANHELRDDGSLVVAQGPDAGQQIAHVPADLIEAMRSNVSLMSSVAALRLFKWEVLEGHRRYYDGEGDRAHILDVPGGWSALCELLGLNPDKDVPAVKAIVEAQARFCFRFPDGSEGNMLVYNSRPASGRHQRAHLRIELGQVLMPGFAARIREKRGRHGYAARMDRRLVPMLRTWPPLVGRPSDHAKQMGMAIALTTEMRGKAESVAELGGAPFELDDFVNLAVASKLPHNSRALQAVLQAWKSGGEDAFLYRVEKSGNLYTLGRPWSVEREFIAAAGRKQTGGGKRAQKGADKKEKWLLGK
jgi:hypothetical protein